MVKDEHADDVLTLGLFQELFTAGLGQLKIDLITYVDFKVGALESKMMEGFSALDRKMDIVEQASEHRDRALSAQIQHLAFSKADWNDIV
jgi:hypothetical protein